MNRDFIIDEVRRNAAEHQGQFCINILLDLILHSQQNQIRQKIVVKLMELVKDLFSRNVMFDTIDETKRVINRICAIMIHIHEKGQNLLMKYCTNRNCEERKMNRIMRWLMQLESSGLPENFNQVNSIKHAIQKWGHTAPKHTFLDVEEAYDILQLILDQYESLRKNSVLVSGVVLRSTSSVFFD